MVSIVQYILQEIPPLLFIDKDYYGHLLAHQHHIMGLLDNLSNTSYINLGENFFGGKNMTFGCTCLPPPSLCPVLILHTCVYSSILHNVRFFYFELKPLLKLIHHCTGYIVVASISDREFYEFQFAQFMKENTNCLNTGPQMDPRDYM